MAWKNLGDRVRLVPQTFGAGVDRPGYSRNHAVLVDKRTPVKPLPGTVTYVHPTHRWYQVTFDCGLKECFFQDVDKESEAHV